MTKTTELCEAVNNGGVIYSMLREEAENRIFFSLKIETGIFGESESIVVEDITPDADECRKLMYALADGFVPPSNALDVIENYIVEFM